MTLKEDIKEAREKASDEAYNLNRQQRDGEAIDDLEAAIKDLRAHIHDLRTYDTWISAKSAEIDVALSMIIEVVEAIDTRIDEIENK